MFVVSLSYTRPLDEVDAWIPAHVQYLETQYAAGCFLASGRKVPRIGGVILARTESREQLDRILAEDPFYKAGVAEYEVTEFIPSMTAPELAVLRES